MRLYLGMKAKVQLILTDAGFTQTLIEPGPELPDVPDSYVLLSPYGGPGLALDGALDDKAWQVRSVGRQNDPDNAEAIADAIDIAFISLPSSKVGGVWVASIQRVGGAPSPLMVDDAERTHYVCNYIVSTQSALVS